MTIVRRSFSTVLLPQEVSQLEQAAEKPAPRRSFSLVLTPDTLVSLDGLATSVVQDERVCEQEESVLSLETTQESSPPESAKEKYDAAEKSDNVEPKIVEDKVQEIVPLKGGIESRIENYNRYKSFKQGRIRICKKQMPKPNMIVCEQQEPEQEPLASQTVAEKDDARIPKVLQDKVREIVRESNQRMVAEDVAALNTDEYSCHQIQKPKVLEERKVRKVRAHQLGIDENAIIRDPLLLAQHPLPKGSSEYNEENCWLAVDYIPDFQWSVEKRRRSGRKSSRRRLKSKMSSDLWSDFERMPGIVEQCPCCSGHQAACCAPAGVAHLNVYNLEGAEGYNYLARAMGLGGVFHVGVEVFGVEWTFAYAEDASFGSGVYGTAPRSSPDGVFLESVPLGKIAPRTAHGVWAILCRMSSQWLSADYHPLGKNCVHFCRAFCKELGVEPPPQWTAGLVDTADRFRSSVYSPFSVETPPDSRAKHKKGLANEWYGVEEDSDSKLLDAMTEFEDVESWALSVMCLHDI